MNARFYFSIGHGAKQLADHEAQQGHNRDFAHCAIENNWRDWENELEGGDVETNVHNVDVYGGLGTTIGILIGREI